MGSAFYSEAQIWPWVRDPAFVTFAINWSDRPDLVCHEAHADCPFEAPHLLATCGRFLPRSLIATPLIRCGPSVEDIMSDEIPQEPVQEPVTEAASAEEVATASAPQSAAEPVATDPPVATEPAS